MSKELRKHRIFSSLTFVSILFLAFNAFTTQLDKNQRFSTIDVERINVIEPDGTVKMIITNVDQFPTGKGAKINDIPTDSRRLGKEK